MKKLMFLTVNLFAFIAFSQENAAVDETITPPTELAQVNEPIDEQFENVVNINQPDEREVFDTKNIQGQRDIIHKKLINYYKKIYKLYPEHTHITNKHINDILTRYYTKVLNQRVITSSECDVVEDVNRQQVMPVENEQLPDQVSCTVRTCCGMQQPAVPAPCCR